MKGFLMFCLDVVVVVSYVDVSATDMFLWGSSWSSIDEVCLLLASRSKIAFSPCLHCGHGIA
jgi:hypothetical protein